MKESGHIEIPPDIAAKCDGPDQFNRFDSLFRKVISHPKTFPPKSASTQKPAKKRAK
jgi:hypothetical protein